MSMSIKRMLRSFFKKKSYPDVRIEFTEQCGKGHLHLSQNKIQCDYILNR